MSDKRITVTLDLSPVQAAALLRLCKKFGHSDAAPYLYPHISKPIRNDQAYDMVHATARVEEALADAGVRDWPWVESREVNHG
jgi:hypothetical protein